MDRNNNEEFCGGVYDITNKKWEQMFLINVSSIEFTALNDSYLVIRNDKTNRPFQICLYTKGEEKVIFEEKDNERYLESSITKDGKYIVINSTCKEHSIVYLIDKLKPDKVMRFLNEPEGLNFIEHSQVY